ncbi:MAG: methyltransferase, TIGR04325 family [Nibricoccus sp.]
MASYAQIARDLIPPLAWNFGKKRLPWLVRAMGGHFTHIRFTGDYASWEDARKASTGYDAPAILQKTRDALLRVKYGEARWEQDAMVSDSDATPSSLLAALMRIAAVKGRPEINVLDFGGSLGSSYFWCRPFFGNDIKVTWCVVEQAEHVKIGQSDFQDGHLRFYNSIDDVVSQHPIDVMLVSGVLHFLPQPHAWLGKIPHAAIPNLILDRTLLWDDDRDRLTVQHVPPEIYQASYPAWFLSKKRVFGELEKNYRLLWTAPDPETWEIDRYVVRNSLHLFQKRAA